MKNYDLAIINSKNQKLVFDIYEPETVKEANQGLSNIQIKDNQGMIYFPIPESGSPCIHPEWITTKATYFPVDFVFVNWNGTIVQIDTVSALSPEIHINPKEMCVVELNAGTCKKLNISVGDSVIHSNLYRLPDNRLSFNDIPFTAIKKDSYDQIDTNNIIAFAFIYYDTIQIFTSTEAFYIDNTNLDIDKVKQIFPLLDKAKSGELLSERTALDWHIYNLGSGQLYIKDKYNENIIKKFDGPITISKKLYDIIQGIEKMVLTDIYKN